MSNFFATDTFKRYYGSGFFNTLQLGDELTSGKPDGKEGIYLGEELGADHPKVKAGVPMHGQNLFPDRYTLTI